MNFTPRERASTALNHRLPDVTPWQIDLTGEAYATTGEYLGDPGFGATIDNHHTTCYTGLVEVSPGRLGLAYD